MIETASILHSDRILCQHATSSKKKYWKPVSDLLAKYVSKDTDRPFFEALLKRERLGSTGLGMGIALPHGRIAALENPVAAIATLQSGVDFDSLDNQPVDIVFALAMPEDCESQHLQILASLAKMFSDSSLCDVLRNAKFATQIHQLLIDG